MTGITQLRAENRYGYHERPSRIIWTLLPTPGNWCGRECGFGNTPAVVFFPFRRRNAEGNDFADTLLMLMEVTRRHEWLVSYDAESR